MSPSPANSSQNQTHGSFSQSQNHQIQNQQGHIVTPSPAAISTAAAVAAINGSFQQAQSQVAASSSSAAPMNHSPISAATKAIVSASSAAGSKPILSVATSTSTQSQPQGTAKYHTLGTTTSLPIHHMNYQQNAALVQNQQAAAAQVQASAFSSFALPQHLNYNTHSFHSYSYRRPPPDATPQIFQKTPLRRGKWTPEEEKYANAIIEAFEKGTIQGCENGCTLRAYLSRKLHCQPMRISKKFAGKSIGKQVFMSRLNSSSLRADGSGGLNALAIQNNNEALKQLEFHFHMSVLQEGISADPSRVIKVMNNANHTNVISATHYHTHAGLQKPMSSNAASMNVLLKTWNHQQPTAHNPLVNVSLLQNPSKHNTIGKTPVATPTTTSTNPQSTSNASCTTSTMNLPHSLLPQTQLNIPTTQMHQHLFNAFKQAQTSHAIEDTKNVDTLKNNTNTATPSSTIQIESKAEDSKGIENSSKLGTEVTVIKSSSEQHTSGSAQQNWMSETIAIIPTLDPTNYGGRYSPTYTSKSFDDLHQFIGHHVPRSPVNGHKTSKGNYSENPAGPATVAANSLTLDKESPLLSPKFIVKSENEAADMELRNIMKSDANTQQPVFMNASDEYAFHAQLSAMEASKHSAYSTAPLPPPKNQLVPIKRCDTPIIPVKKQSHIGTANVASFNNANLELHSKNPGNFCIRGVPPMSLEQSAAASFTKYTVPTVFQKQGTPLVSGSERSSDMGDIGTDGSISVGGTSSGTSSSRTGSDNDSASDEGRGPIRVLHKGKRKSNNLEVSPYPTDMSALSSKKVKLEGGDSL